jgi:hypothetical protein
MSNETYISLSGEAHRRAERYAPSPKTDPVRAGMYGAVVAAVIITVFTSLAGLRSEAFPMAVGFTIGRGPKSLPL